MKINRMFIRKFIKRMKWRIANLSLKQFVLEFVFRRFNTIELDAVPSYDFHEIDRKALDSQALSKPKAYFLMIKPNGLHKEGEIKKWIDNAGLMIYREVNLYDFFSIAFHLFNIPKIKDYWNDMPEGLIWLNLLERFYPETCRNLKVLYIKNGDEEKLNQLKTRLRRKIGVEFFRVKIGSKNIVTCMTPVHTPEEKDLEYELKVIQYFEEHQR